MRILFVTNNYKPYSGGVVSSIDSSVQELKKCGHDVFIVTLTFLDCHDDPSWVMRVPCPITFMYKKNHMAIPWRSRFMVSRIISQLCPDIIHVHHPFLLCVDALKIAKKRRIPIVFTYHTMYEHYAHYIPLPSYITKPIIKRIVISFCQLVDGIIAPSSSIKNYLRECDVKKMIDVIPSSLQPFFYPRNDAIKKCSAGDPFQILVVSRFAKEKNIPFLLGVFASLKRHNVHLTLIGYGAEYESLKNHAFNVLKLSPSTVRFIHKPQKTVIVDHYHKADLFLFSSICDTQGLVLAEAMAGATPVLALDGPGQRDIIRDGYNGFIVKDAAEMIEKITLLANDSSLFVTMKKQAWQTASHYLPSILTGSLLRFYDRVQERFIL